MTEEHIIQELNRKIIAFQGEVEMLKKEAADREWAVRKTNDGIKILYKELEKRNTDLQKLDKLKSDFVSTVSHELRTPLTITTEGLSLVLDEIAGPINEKQREILDTSKKNVERLNRIINDLLDISKIEAGRLELRFTFVDVCKLIHGIADSYQNVVATKSIRLEMDLPEEEIFLYIDSDKITQTILNLINNAFKFTPENGVISVGIKRVKDQVEFYVQDSGVGIAAEDMPKLFGKFQQFSRTHGPGIKGTGLGLAICKALVELHGGRIWAESEINKGTKFCFTLASYDSVRGNFDNRFDDLLQSCQLHKETMALIIIQLNNFSRLTDGHTNERVMEVMNEMNAAVKSAVTRQSDEMFFYDKRSIYLLLPETNRSGASAVARRIEKNFGVAQERMSDLKEPPVFRMGVSMYPQDGATREELIKVAMEWMVKKQQVLVVDDHPQVLRMLELRLKSLNLDVVTLQSGKEALAYLADHQPDLIVLDVIMPEMSGYELYGRLKENPETSEIPVILLTADNINTGLIETHTNGRIPIIQKSGGFERLIQKVKDIL